jgi:transposase
MPRPSKNNKIDNPQHKKIINSIYDEGLTVAETAKRFGFPYHTVRSISQKFETDGSDTTKPRGGNKYPVLAQEHINYLVEQLDEHPDGTIDELTNGLNQNFDFSRPISRTAVSRVVREQAGYTLKLLRSEPEDFNSGRRIQERMDWAREFLEMGRSMMDAVYVDEAGFNLHLTRRFGRAPRGRRATKVRPTQRGKNMSVAIAVSREGILAHDVRLGAYNSVSFTEFIRTKLLPALHHPKIILMDNVPFHKNSDVCQAIESAGHVHLRLPTYSPFLNAAEWVFGHIKSHVRRQDLHDNQTLTAVIGADVGSITADMCGGWVREVNRNFGRAHRGEELGREYT